MFHRLVNQSIAKVGVPELVVFLNKVDLLSEGDAELQELVEMEVRYKIVGWGGGAGVTRTWCE